jgi:hypothetical protein
MSRRFQQIEYLLESYVRALRSAVTTYRSEAEKTACAEHLRTAELLLARWRGGCSPESVRDALAVEWMLLTADRLGGPEAEKIGETFGYLQGGVSKP